MPELGYIKNIEGDQARIFTSNDCYEITLSESQKELFREKDRVNVTVIGTRKIIEKIDESKPKNAIQETSEYLEDCIEEAKDLIARVNWGSALLEEKEIDLTYRIATTIFINSRKSRN